MPRLPLPAAEPRRQEFGASRTPGLAILVVVVAALYFGREIFVPLALALILSFALAPAVSWLRRRRIPQIPAVIGVVMLAFVAIFGFGVVVAGQVSQLAGNLPQYQYNIQDKIRSFRASAAEGGIFQRASEMLRELGDEIERQAGPAPRGVAEPAPAVDRATPVPPLAVRIQPPAPQPLQILQTVIGPLIEPLATGGIVIVFVVFMLLQRGDMRDRFIRLAGADDLHRTTDAIGDAGRRVGRYLLMQLLVNVSYGVPIGIGLWIIGVPNPLLWGMLAMILRFVPYIGPLIGSMFPLALSIAVDPGWTLFLWTAALFVVLELVSNNVVEPWLYGASTGLSPLAVIAAAIFWTWLWGPIGLLLSTPLTVCLVVLGRHVPRFGFLDVLLGSEPVLTPPESLYQRLLAGDPDEATEKAEEFLETRPLLDFYEDVAIPALSLMEHDRARGVLGDDRRAVIAASFLTLVDNLSDHEDAPPVADAAAAQPGDGVPPVRLPTLDAATLAPDWRDRPVLCAGGRGNLDDAAAAILGQLFERCGVGTRLLSFDANALATYAGLDLTGVRVICLSYMNAGSLAHARYLVRRLRRRTDARILIGFWSLAPEEAQGLDLVKLTRADLCATCLGDAVDQVVGGIPTVAPTATPGDGSAAEPGAALQPAQ